MDLVTLGLFVVGFFLLVFGADIMVRGAAHLAVAANISPLAIGLTIVAFGSSAPELAINVQAAYAGQPGLAIGNVVGSNIANILLILGIAAIITPLAVSSQLLRKDVPLMIGASFVMYFMAFDGEFNRIDGLILFAALVMYTVHAIIGGRLETVDTDGDIPSEAGSIPLQIALIVGGLAMLTMGANWLVNGAVMIATWLGISELIIGLTIVAFGTSLPELATSVTAALRKHADMAVGNVVGSNIFNILSVLGLSSIVAPAGISVDASALNFDIPVMLAVAVLCLPIFFTGHSIDRWEGAAFLFFYIAYLSYLVLFSLQHAALQPFSMTMMWFILPLTVLTLLVMSWQYWRQHYRQ
jgi:cation:H+ antiporter